MPEIIAESLVKDHRLPLSFVSAISHMIREQSNHLLRRILSMEQNELEVMLEKMYAQVQDHHGPRARRLASDEELDDHQEFERREKIKRDLEREARRMRRERRAAQQRSTRGRTRQDTPDVELAYVPSVTRRTSVPKVPAPPYLHPNHHKVPVSVNLPNGNSAKSPESSASTPMRLIGKSTVRASPKSSPANHFVPVTSSIPINRPALVPVNPSSLPTPHRINNHHPMEKRTPIQIAPMKEITETNGQAEEEEIDVFGGEQASSFAPWCLQSLFELLQSHPDAEMQLVLVKGPATTIAPYGVRCYACDGKQRFYYSGPGESFQSFERDHLNSPQHQHNIMIRRLKKEGKL